MIALVAAEAVLFDPALGHEHADDLGDGGPADVQNGGDLGAAEVAALADEAEGLALGGVESGGHAGGGRWGEILAPGSAAQALRDELGAGGAILNK